MKAENIRQLTLTKEEAKVLEDFWYAADDLGFDVVDSFVEFYREVIIDGKLNVNGVKIHIE